MGEPADRYVLLGGIAYVVPTPRLRTIIKQILQEGNLAFRFTTMVDNAIMSIGKLLVHSTAQSFLECVLAGGEGKRNCMKDGTGRLSSRWLTLIAISRATIRFTGCCSTKHVADPKDITLSKALASVAQSLLLADPTNTLICQKGSNTVDLTKYLRQADLRILL